MLNRLFKWGRSDPNVAHELIGRAYNRANDEEFAIRAERDAALAEFSNRHATTMEGIAVDIENAAKTIAASLRGRRL